MQPYPGRLQLLACLVLAGSATGQNAAALGKQIRKGEEPEQVAAAIKIGAMGPKRAKAIPDLLWGLQNSTERFRIAAIPAVARIGKKAVPYLKKALNNKDDLMRIAALMVIPQLAADAESLQPMMRKLWRYERIDLSDAVSDAFVGLGAHAVPEMIEGVEDFVNQQRACQVLGRIGKPAQPAVPALLKLLKSNSHGRSSAGWPLGRIGDPKTIPVMIEVIVEATKKLDSACDGAASGCARSLGEFGPAAAAAVPALLDLMEQKRQAGLDRVCSECAWALADIGTRNQEVLDRLRKLAATTESAEIRKAAKDSFDLLAMSKTASKGALTRGLRHPSAELRLLALKRIVERGTKLQGIGRSVARRLSKDPDISVRLAAVAALMALKETNDDIVDSLMAAAKSPDPQLKKAATEALAHLAPKGEDAKAKDPKAKAAKK